MIVKSNRGLQKPVKKKFTKYELFWKWHCQYCIGRSRSVAAPNWWSAVSDHWILSNHNDALHPTLHKWWCSRSLHSPMFPFRHLSPSCHALVITMQLQFPLILCCTTYVGAPWLKGIVAYKSMSLIFKRGVASWKQATLRCAFATNCSKYDKIWDFMCKVCSKIYRHLTIFLNITKLDFVVQCSLNMI